MSQTVYLWFPGNAAEALNFYHSIFGGELKLFTFEQFNRTDGPASAIAHGELTGLVNLYGTDAVEGEDTVSMAGISLTLLGTSTPETLTTWFEELSAGGTIIDPLQRRPWGATDGQLRDKYGVRWLIGYEEN